MGKRLRSILLDVSSAGLSHRAEALLYAADRAEHVDTVVRPALERGAIVISDRYIDSSVAYQGAGRDLSPTEIARINRWATGGLVPHLTVLLDVSPEAARERFTEAPDRLESEPAEFHQRVRSGFLMLAAVRPRPLSGRRRGAGARGRHRCGTPPPRPVAAALRSRDQGPGKRRGKPPRRRPAARPRKKRPARRRKSARRATARQQLAKLRAEEEERKRLEIEEARRREEERQAAEARRQAEEARRLAEEERARREAAEQAREQEQERLRQQKAEEGRLRAEAEERRREKQRKAEAALLRAEEARRAEEAEAAAAASAAAESARAEATAAEEVARHPEAEQPDPRDPDAGNPDNESTVQTPMAGANEVTQPVPVARPTPSRPDTSTGSDADQTRVIPRMSDPEVTAVLPPVREAAPEDRVPRGYFRDETGRNAPPENANERTRELPYVDPGRPRRRPDWAEATPLDDLPSLADELLGSDGDDDRRGGGWGSR